MMNQRINKKTPTLRILGPQNWRLERGPKGPPLRHAGEKNPFDWRIQ